MRNELKNINFDKFLTYAVFHMTSWVYHRMSSAEAVVSDTPIKQI